MKLLLPIAICILSVSLYAQNFALRWHETTPEGPATNIIAAWKSIGTNTSAPAPFFVTDLTGRNFYLAVSKTNYAIWNSNVFLPAVAAAQDANIRAEAASPLVSFNGNGLLFRAFADLIKDGFNELRLEMSISKTNIALFQSRPTLPPRTFQQLQTAITNKIAQHTVDTNSQISLLGPRKRQTVVAVRAPKDSKP